LALVLCLPRRFPGITQALVAAAAFVLLLLPWWAYQRYDDPPGDRLIKWHLAGVIPLDDRPISRTLIESYAALTPAQLLKNKSDNLRALVGRPFIPPQYLPTNSVDAWRNDAYYNVLKCLGILNAGWLVLAVSRHNRPPRVRAILALALLGLAVWCLLMFGPGTTW